MKIETANNMTPQQLLDYAVKKLVKQGERCVDQYDALACQYGNGRGGHCLIGWCLDENNPDLMDHEGDVPTLIKQGNIPIPIVKNVKLFNLAQRFHDSPSRMIRERRRNELHKKFQIDTTGHHWKQWVELAEEP